MEVGSWCWIAQKGKLVQKAAVFIEVEEILFDESEGLASAGALGNSRKGGAFFGLALAIFGES